MQEAKVVVIGSVGVGKSCLTTRYIFNQFNQNMPTTLGASYFQKVHELSGGQSMKFQFWDTAGQQKFKSIAKIYYKDARVAIIVYDISNRQSFDGLKIWMDQLEDKGPKNLIVAIVGNKIDLLDQAVSISQAQQYAKMHSALFKLTSAKQDKGIKQLFDSIGDQIINLNNHRSNSTLKNSQSLNNSNKQAKKKKCC